MNSKLSKVSTGLNIYSKSDIMSSHELIYLIFSTTPSYVDKTQAQQDEAT